MNMPLADNYFPFRKGWRNQQAADEAKITGRLVSDGTSHG